MHCRIKNIKPPCSYKADGITSIMALDYDNFNGLRFEGDDLYKNCLVIAILRSGEFIDIDTPDSAKYSSTLQNGIYTHTLETFISELSAEMIATLHLVTKRRYLMIFKTKAGRYFCFGYEAGATFSYTNQTTDGSGSLVTISVTTTYPIFEVDAKALTDNTHIATYVPSPVNAYCDTLDGGNTGILQHRYMLKVSAINNNPLDINNIPCEKSDKQQAVLILKDSPIITGYEVEGYFAKGAIVAGVPTFVFNTTVCPIKIKDSIGISEAQIFIEVGASKTVNLTSTSPWQVTNPNSSIASLNFLDGFAGTYPVQVTGVSNGLYNFDIVNTETGAKVRLSVVVGSIEWVFKNGAWNDNGYWLTSGKWE